MGMVKLRPLTKSKPLTEYDKTLHNRLRLRNPKFVPIGRKGAPGEIREMLLFFSPDSPTEVTRALNFTRDGSKHAL